MNNYREFIMEKIKESFPEKEIPEGGAISNLLIDPIYLITKPIIEEINNTRINQSLKRILELDNPNEYPKENVDDILSNMYFERRKSKKSHGIARLYFNRPIYKEWTKGSLIIFAKNGKKYENAYFVSIESNNMAKYQENGKYYYDISVVAVEEGEDSNIYSNDLNNKGFINTSDHDLVGVKNIGEVLGGLDEETNIDFINRSKESLGARIMSDDNGLKAVLFENFSDTIRDVQGVGYSDFEMTRDIIHDVHVGGCIDAYVKTNHVREGNFKVIGLMPDYTKEIEVSSSIQLTTSDYKLSSQFLKKTPLISSAKNDDSILFFSAVNFDSDINYSEKNASFQLNIDGINRIINLNNVNTEINSKIILESINTFYDSKKISKLIRNPIIIKRRNSGCIAENSQYFEDYNSEIFKYIMPGDFLHIHNGFNKGHYKIKESSENKLKLDIKINLKSDFNIAYSISRSGLILCIYAENQLNISPYLEKKELVNKIFGYTNTSINILKMRQKYYEPDVDFKYDPILGTVKRIENDSQIITNSDSGLASPGIYFYDSNNKFLNVKEGDILRILDVPLGYEYLKKDYRILGVLDGLRIEGMFSLNSSISNIVYQIRRNNILEGENVSVSYIYSPLSIDIGTKTNKNSKGLLTSIREGREKETITDMAFMDIININLIDPITKTALPIKLKNNAGYGRGGFGRGGFGRGEGADYKLIVNNPSTRFSEYEDSFIEINPIYAGQSFEVRYRFIPEIPIYQRFVEDSNKRVLSAGILVRSFHLGYVDITVRYKISDTLKAIPTPEFLRAKIIDYINYRPSGLAINASDIIEIISQEISEDNKGKSLIYTPIIMKCTIHNKKGDIMIIQDNNSLDLPKNEVDPFKATSKITRWLANEIVMIPMA